MAETTLNEVMEFIEENDVKFIRLAFCDYRGTQKNVSVMPEELKTAVERGEPFDSFRIEGFDDQKHQDLFLSPDLSTMCILPWRPQEGRVLRFYCDVITADGTPYFLDPRSILKDTIAQCKKLDFKPRIGLNCEFYLFRTDEEDNPTLIPWDQGRCYDITPLDRGENIRREICLTLEQMGIHPESSHHEEGPGQNEIDFRYSDALSAADNTMVFQRVAKIVANRNGLAADFSPKPLKHGPGNGFHINLSVTPSDDHEKMRSMIAGILERVCEMSVFLNPTENSYLRFGQSRAPRYISWSEENRSQLIRIPAALGEYRRMELRSPDPSANPYIAFTLLIYAALEGMDKKMPLKDAVDENLYDAPEELLAELGRLPSSLDEARRAALASEFINRYIPGNIIDLYCR